MTYHTPPRSVHSPKAGSRGGYYVKKDNSFSMYAKFSEKQTFRSPWYTHVRTCVYQGVRNISFLENLAYILNNDPLWKTWKMFIIY